MDPTETKNSKSSENDLDEKVGDLNKNWDIADILQDQENKTKCSTIQNYQSREFSENQLRSILKSGANQGLTGLQNLGNTCFMNSALQCLSHSVDLTYFMLSKEFMNEINSENPLSQGGKIAKNYYKLLDNLWNGNSRSFAPSDLKSSVARRASQFAGYGQQDSHELLSYLLDGLHEDLNKITNKPYKEVPEKKPEETDEIAAKRFWDSHKLRNDSIIVDLFNGQYRSSITCPDCYRVSITYDPFLSVTLTIPKRTKKEVYVVPRVNILRTSKLTINVSEDSLFYDIPTYINKINERKISRARCMVVLDNVVTKLNQVSEKLSAMKTGSFVFCCEVNQNMLKKQYYTLPVHFYNYNENDYHCYPRMFTISEDQTIYDLKVLVFGFMRRYLNLPEEIKNAVGDDYDNLVKILNDDPNGSVDDYDAIIKKEYDIIFSQNSTINKDAKDAFINSLPFNAYIEEIKGEKSYVFNYLSESSNLLDENSSISNIIQLNKNGSKFIIGIDMKKGENIFNESVRQLRTCVSIKEKTSGLTLSDCLDHFKMTEKLDKSNEWYCNVCKEHKRAHKKMDLFYTPKLLILVLKRFEYTTVGSRYYRTYAEKINDSVDFPIDELDLRPWVVGPHSPPPVYELYAVSQHYGSTGGGHYTAVAKNFGQWHNFNDSSVSKVNGKNFSDCASYLLFYRRKDISK